MQKAILLLLLIFPFAAFSQKDFRPGFVVLNSGDTVKGLVLYRLGPRISNECFYRATRKGETRVYKADELQSYAVTNDKYYASMVLDSATKEKVFVEKLVTGKVSIFRYQGLSMPRRTSFISWRNQSKRSMTRMYGMNMSTRNMRER